MKQETKHLLRRTLCYLLPYKREFLVVGLTLVLSTVIGFLQPLVIQRITDSGMMQRDMAVILSSALLLALLVLGNQAIDLLQTRIFADVHNASYYAIFHQVFEKLLHLKKSYFEDKNSAEILSFLQMDVSQVSSVTDRYTVLSVSYVFRIVSGLIGLFLISWKLALIVLCMVPVKFLLVRGLSKRQEQAMDEMIESSRDFSRWFGDDLNGVDEIKLWDLFQSRDQVFREKQEKVLGVQKRTTMIGGWNSFWEMLLEWSVTILLYVLGGWLICAGSLTIGAVFAFVSYSAYVTGPVSALINLKMYFARIFPSARRLFRFLDMETELDTGTTPLKGWPPKLEFRNVEFWYEEERPILQGVSLDVQDIPLEEYRGLFSVVSQEPYLFLGDILENVDLQGDADPDRLEAALRASGVESYLPRLPEKERTQIGRNGARLSGGEKQKLAVARALLKDASVVILDEATSGFDVESDAYLHDVILHQMQGKTVIMITHHYHNLEGMDQVWRLEGGKVLPVERSLHTTTQITR